MSGIWFGLVALAIGLVARWYILTEAKLRQAEHGAGEPPKKKKWTARP